MSADHTLLLSARLLDTVIAASLFSISATRLRGLAGGNNKRQEGENREHVLESWRVLTSTGVWKRG